jgi:hypothetical protein
VNAWSRWVALLDRRESGESLAACRIVASVAVLWEVIEAWSTGAAAAMWVDQRFGGVRLIDRAGVLAWFGGATTRNVSALIVTSVIAGLFSLTGLFGRVAVPMTWLCWRTIAGLNDHSGGSGDDLLTNVLFVLSFADTTRAFSLDARLRGHTGDVTAWPRYVLIAQLAVMYEATALQKISAGWVPWGPLDALWYVLQQPTWQRFPMRWVAPFYPLTQLGSLFTWTFENSAPVFALAMYYRATRDRPGRLRAWFNRVDVRKWYLLAGLAMHVGISLLMDVGSFFPAVMACYACCVTPDEWKRFARRAATASRIT